MCTVKHTESPMLSTKITAGIADNFMFKNIITPSSCINVATELKMMRTAAQTESRRIPTQMNAAANAHKMINSKKMRRLMYCSQNMNGMPDG